MWFLLSLWFAFWTSIAISIVKRLTGRVDSLLIILINNLFILPFMLAIIFLQGGVPNVTQQFYLLMLFSSVFDVAAAVSSMIAIKMSPISLISPISSFNPVFTTLIAMAALGEVPSTTKFLGIVVIVLGSYLLNISDMKTSVLAPFKNLFSQRGVQLFLLANFLWGVTPIFQKQAIFQTQPTLPLFPSFFGAVLVALFITPLVLRKGIQQFTPIRKNIAWFIFLAPFSALAQLAAFTAFSLTNVGYVTAIFKLSVLFTVAWGALFFKEERIKERLLGAIVMLTGTMLLIL